MDVVGNWEIGILAFSLLLFPLSVHPFIHFFLRQMFIEYLLRARHFAVHSSEPGRNGNYILEGKRGNKYNETNKEDKHRL